MSDIPSGRPRSVLRPSLLRRLIGGEGAKVRPIEDLRLSLRELRQEVMDDLEELLNTRATDTSAFAELEEARESVLAYGLPDLSRYSPSSEDDLKDLMGLIAETIRRFEPRLESVKVERVRRADQVGNDQEELNRRTFRIDAVLHVEPIRESISFATRVDMDSGTVLVEDNQS